MPVEGKARICSRKIVDGVTRVTCELSRCYPRFDLEWMVEGGWLCRGLHCREWFSEAGGSLDAAKDTRTTDDGEPGRLPLKIREAAPGMRDVQRENERELALNIERGLNSKISLRAVH